MKFSADKRSTVKLPVESLLCFAFDGAKEPSGAWQALDVNLQRKFTEAAAHEDFKGREKTTLVFYPADGRPARRVVVAGLGKLEKIDAEKLRRATAVGFNRLKGAGVKEVAVLPPENAKIDVELREQGQVITEGVALAAYEFKKYKSDNGEKKQKVESVRLLADGEKSRDALAEGARRGDIFARATCFTRNLVNEHPEVCTPTYLASKSQETVKGQRDMTIRVIDGKQARKLGMGGLVGVSLGSDEPPRFVHMTYRAPGAKKTIAICGKGITFDSGGLCIKPADGMLNMKDDMSGAAAVIGVFQALREFKPKVNVHGIFAATENMPGDGAYKTRDVLRAMNGKTMEIINTDAEGRVVLSDALSYASKLKPDQIIDLATLTGACVVALGPEISGIFGTDQTLVKDLITAGRSTGEKIWQLPLDDDYFEMIKSEVADMKNSGGRWGGSITAALFLKEFVDPAIPWAHVDIAGPALVESSKPYLPAGGTGVMVRTLLRYFETQAK
jgi:leucyl aminopeptidase